MFKDLRECRMDGEEATEIPFQSGTVCVRDH